MKAKGGKGGKGGGSGQQFLADGRAAFPGAAEGTAPAVSAARAHQQQHNMNLALEQDDETHHAPTSTAILKNNIMHHTTN